MNPDYHLMQVDFSYAFATPHRLTIALPDSSNKTLLDVSPDHLRMAWSYDNLVNKPLAAFMTPRTEWEVLIRPMLDGKAMFSGDWQRGEGWLPVLEQVYVVDGIKLRLEVVGGAIAAMVRVEVENQDVVPHWIELQCEKPGTLLGTTQPGCNPIGIMMSCWQAGQNGLTAFWFSLKVVTAGMYRLRPP